MPLQDFSKHRLLAPGPVPLSEKVRQSLSAPMIHHRTPEFEAILQSCWKNLQWMFQTTQPVLILPTTGSGGMEAVMTNTLSPGDSVLVVVSGKFGERWKKMAEVYGLNAESFDSPWGKKLDLAGFEKKLQSKAYSAVFTQVCETSTATLHPIQEMAALHRRHQKGLFIVDAITAIGCTPLPMEEWGLDGVVAGSQKAFALPTGLAFVALSEKAWKANSHSGIPKFYLDLKKEREANEKGQTHFSSSVTLVRALSVALQEFQEMGLDSLLKLIHKRAQATREGLTAMGLKIYSESPSPSVTAVEVPSALDGAKLRAHIESQYRITLMGGQDHLKGKILRFGHMGNISPDDILASLEALGLACRDFGLQDMSDEKIQSALERAGKILK